VAEAIVLICDQCGKPDATSITIRAGARNFVKDLCRETSPGPAQGHASPPPGPTQGRDLFRIRRTEGRETGAEMDRRSLRPERELRGRPHRTGLRRGRGPARQRLPEIAPVRSHIKSLRREAFRRDRDNGSLEIGRLEDERPVVPPLTFCQQTRGSRFEQEGLRLGAIAQGDSDPEPPEVVAVVILA
jgi:hypothetical protein